MGISCFIETKLGLAMNEQGAGPALELTLLREEWEISPGSLQLLPAVSLHQPVHPHLPPHPKRPFFQENFINTYVPQNADGQVTKWMHLNNCMGVIGKAVVVGRALCFCILGKSKCEDKLQDVGDTAWWAQKSCRHAFEAKQ